MEREEVLNEILRRIQQAGGTLVVPTKTLAFELGMKPQRMYNLINSFERRGEIVTVSRGPIGTELRAGTGRPVPAPAGRRSRVVPSPRRGPAASTGGARKFCPWCGEAIADPRWLYCAGCGRELPR